MLKNIVFDMGNVLIKWNSEEIMTTAGILREEDREIARKQMFGTVEWILQDWGDYDEKTFEPIVFARTPEYLHEGLHRALCLWPDHMVPMPGMKDFLKVLKEQGYHLYILSNASVALNDYRFKIPGYEYFDGYVVSASEHLLKPQPQIFQRLLEKYSLKAEECLFVDDLPLNCAGARVAGMDSFVFSENIPELKAYIKERA